MGTLWIPYVPLVKELWVLYAGLSLTRAPAGFLLGLECSAPIEGYFVGGNGDESGGDQRKHEPQHDRGEPGGGIVLSRGKNQVEQVGDVERYKQ